MGNSISADAVSPPLEFAHNEEDKIPFAPDGMDAVMGSFGTVMRVKPTSSRFAGVGVAVCKTIRLLGSEQCQLEREMDRIRRAAAQLSRTRHPHLLPVIATYFFFSRGGVQFSVVADYVPRDLHAYLGSSPPVLLSGDEDEAASSPLGPLDHWFGCLIGVVAYLHRRGIRHGDIRPENIRVRDGKRVLLNNFDLSDMDAWSARQTTRAVNLKWGRWKVSAGGRYGAPETEESGPGSESGGFHRGRAADIFSLGAILLELLLASHDRRNNRSDTNGYGARLSLSEQLEETLHPPTGTVKSYANNIGAVGRWIAELDLLASSSQQDKRRHKWEVKLLALCGEMLDPEPDARPRADELHRHWRSAMGVDPAALQCPVCEECEAEGHDSDADTTDGPRETALFWAAGHGTEDKVRALLQVDAVNAQNLDGWSALHYAARMNRAAAVGLLLDEGANIELVDHAGWTALHFAARKGREGVVRILLERGAQVSAVDRWDHTALHLAAAAGHAKVVDALLEQMKKEDVNRKTSRGHTALSMAASGGHRQAVMKLVACDKVDIRVLAR